MYVMTARSSLSIREAADILGIADQASINEIRSRYHALVKEWHPDVSDHEPEDTHNKMIRFNDAYDTLIEYCMQYEFSFRPEDLIQNARTDPVNSWMERYGDDPIWGPRRSPPHRSS
jgi:pantothenate kinase